MKAHRRKQQSQLPDEPRPLKRVKLPEQQQARGKNTTQESIQLPIKQYKDRIVDLVRSNQVVVITGETGSGKTTQVPQYLFEAGFRSICISQPRRISAITLARRVASEVGCDIGQAVGYSVRFEEQRSAQTAIHFVTDGMAIRELMVGRRYDVFVLDEAHERSINTDVLLAVLKQQLQRYPRLKLVIMSATIDISKFLNFFESTTYLSIEGRTFPIGLYYTLEPQVDYVRTAVNTILQIHMTEEPGGILVFLTGQQEIQTVHKILQDKIQSIKEPHKRNVSVKMLFSALPSEMQLQAFCKAEPDERKVVLATNIAETSVTIDGIRYVVDCGFCKMRLFDHERNLEILALLPVSKSNALQRAGRAGRQQPGKCFRLYNQNSYQELPDYHLPEILRVDISNSLLQLKSIGVKRVKDFQFMDAPEEAAIDHGLEILREIGALDTDEQITERGKELAELPLPPEMSHLLLMSLEKEYLCPELMLSCISLLSVQNLFYVPQRQHLLKVFKRYEVKNSDHLTKINILHQYFLCANKKSFSKENFINSKSIKKIIEVRKQLEDYVVAIWLARQRKDVFNKHNSDPKETRQKRVRDMLAPRQKIRKEAFLRCLSKASNRRIARLSNDGSYTICVIVAIIQHSLQSAKIHPESICFMAKPRPQMIVFSEIVKTQKVYLREVSEVQTSATHKQ